MPRRLSSLFRDLLELEARQRAAEEREAVRTAAVLSRRGRPQCGARTRTGHPCRALVHWPKGATEGRKRCRMHGGLSTGPRTPEGRAAIAASNRRRAAAENEPEWRATNPRPEASD